MSKQKKTLVIGASENPERYSFLAINLLRDYGHPVAAIGNKKGKVGDVNYTDEMQDFDSIDTVTFYLNSQKQKAYYEYILNLNPKRIIFNPGAENEEFKQLALEKGVQVLEACTLVLLKTGQF